MGAGDVNHFEVLVGLGGFTLRKGVHRSAGWMSSRHWSCSVQRVSAPHTLYIVLHPRSGDKVNDRLHNPTHRVFLPQAATSRPDAMQPSSVPLERP